MAGAESLGQSLYRHRTGLGIGALIGLFSGGIVGLLLGGALGFLIDRALRTSAAKYNPQQLFFRATFTVMGKVAKADGRVSETEINFAREVMARMNLSEEKRREAIECFSEGKQAEFEISSVLLPLGALLRHRSAVKLMFVEIQLQAAMADGEVSPAEQALLSEICRMLQFTPDEAQALLSRIRAEQAFREQAYRAHQDPQQFSGATLEQAYGVLGVEPSASDAEVKKAWRRLMSQHHPDKLVSKGLPEEMIQLAKEQTQEIQAAYDQIRKARGMR
ncbi:co-chaperone protein DjlA [Marinobacterium zhoushanense]|uniref:Co-chaperone protein DjlA n=1 Tax=Marinobacterium zhoushanense TaxID=1679163 RepID=A0ABQ1K365_9GAMM|nr:co-chaperone DjlA [Marinobacterium zhoushanense]GGB83815.1 co-chaperone protein DjlA [Marinobacterium zhoushanense]